MTDPGKLSSAPAATPFPWSGRMGEVAEEVARVLGSAMKPDAVWLFGSVARGTEGMHSDLDLLVIVPESEEPRYRRAQTAHRIVSGIRAPKEILVMTREEWDRDLRAPASLASAVRREGRQLYGA